MMRVWRLSVAYMEPKSRTERHKIKIGTEVAHITRDSDTTVKVKRSQERGYIVAASRLQLVKKNFQNSKTLKRLQFYWNK